jgi:hypothetical protein
LLEILCCTIDTSQTGVGISEQDFMLEQVIADKTKDFNSTCSRYSCSLTHNLPRTEAEKITKYESLALEINNVCEA